MNNKTTTLCAPTDIHSRNFVTFINLKCPITLMSVFSARDGISDRSCLRNLDL